jgi:uncharacterized protein YkwD
LAGSALARDAQSPPSTSSAKDKSATLLSKEARQEITRYHLARKAAQRAAAIADLVATGDEGKSAAKDIFEKELKLVEPAVRAAEQPTRFDEPMEKLRKVLADLRNDPNLTKDQLKKVGLPTLEELTVVYGQWKHATSARAAKSSRAIEQLHQLIAVLKVLQEKWPLDAPIPVNDFIAQAETQLTKLLCKDDEEAQRILAENRAHAAKFPADIRIGMDEANAVRMVCGLRPLAYDQKLCAAALEHSSEMQSHNYFAHESPTEGKKTPWDRAKLVGTTASGENIFKGAGDAHAAIKGWFLSPGHHKNMLSKSTRRQGLGRAGELWTQMFGD